MASTPSSLQYRHGRGQMILSPISSPERMDLSEQDSSFDQSPLNVYNQRSGMPQQQKDIALSRRLSCPAPVYNNQERSGTRHSQNSRRTTFDFLDTIDRDFGTMQLSSPPSGIQPLQRSESLNLKSSAVSSSNASTKSTASSLFSLLSSNTQHNDSDCSDNSTCSSATVRASNNNNGEGDGKSLLSAENLAQLSKKDQFSSIYKDEDEMSTNSKISCKTTGPERSAMKQNARNNNRKGQFLCYVHSVVLCLAVCIVGYFGSSELRKQWCVSSQSVNVTQLEEELHLKVFGQHIATSVITRAFQDFFSSVKNSDSSMPSSLVFSLHGWTGIGKNYVSTIVSELIPSSTVTKLIIPLHFPHSGPEYADLYRINIEKWILTNISQCAVNLFIIDEMDKATEPLILGLKSAIHTIKEKHWNNTKTVILLLSNTAGYNINKAVFTHLNNGHSRSDLTQNMMQEAILNDPSATWHVDLFKNKLVDELVPFLPLQYEHVVKCIKSYLKSRGEKLPQKKITEIAKEFDYFPQEKPIFSKTGCKRVTSKTDLYLE